jgi:hypothetical protein
VADDVNGKLDILITEIQENSEKLENIETLLIGDVKNTNKIGLVERIRKIEQWIEKREWFEKVIIVAIVVNTIGLIFVLIQNLIY